MSRDQHDAASIVPQPLTEEELLALWRDGLAIARRCCARNLARLRTGEGGFYQAADLEQDLFLAFWELARAWRARGEADPETLWRAWRRALWGGGLHILRRAPQRLWASARERVPWCSPGQASPNASPAQQALLAGLARALVAPDDVQEECFAHAALARLRAALEQLSDDQREILFLSADGEHTAAEIAETLGLPSPNAASQRLHRAREALRRALAA